MTNSAQPPAFPRSPLTREATFLVLNAAFWAAAAAAMLLVADVFRPTLASARQFAAVHAGGCFLATLVMRWFATGDGLLGRLGMSRAGAMAGSLILATVVLTICSAPIDAWFGLPRAATPRRYLLAMFVVHAVMLATWSLLYFGYRLVRDAGAAALRAREAESIALRHELGQLQSRSGSRFLFDALGTVADRRRDPVAVGTLVGALSNYLRFLGEPTAVLEPLGRELDAVEEYLTVQRVRLGDLIEATVECEPGLRHIPVLPMMIQPLVENAVVHGGASGDPLRIVVRAARDADELVVEVGNSGRWLQPDHNPPVRSGLQALRRRLELWSGPDATLTTSEEVGWVWVTIRCRLEPQYAATASVTPVRASSPDPS